MDKKKLIILLALSLSSIAAEYQHGSKRFSELDYDTKHFKRDKRTILGLALSPLKWLSFNGASSTPKTQSPPVFRPSFHNTNFNNYAKQPFSTNAQIRIPIGVNGELPAFKIHRYNGIHLKPVPLQSIRQVPPINVPISTNHVVSPQYLQPIKSDLSGDIHSDESLLTSTNGLSKLLGPRTKPQTLRMIADIASSKEGLKMLADLIESGILPVNGGTFKQETESAIMPKLEDREPTSYEVPIYQPSIFNRKPIESFPTEVTTPFRMMSHPPLELPKKPAPLHHLSQKTFVSQPRKPIFFYPPSTTYGIPILGQPNRSANLTSSQILPYRNFVSSRNEGVQQIHDLKPINFYNFPYANKNKISENEHKTSINPNTENTLKINESPQTFNYYIPLKELENWPVSEKYQNSVVAAEKDVNNQRPSQNVDNINKSQFQIIVLDQKKENNSKFQPNVQDIYKDPSFTYEYITYNKRKEDNIIPDDASSASQQVEVFISPSDNITQLISAKPLIEEHISKVSVNEKVLNFDRDRKRIQLEEGVNKLYDIKKELTSTETVTERETTEIPQKVLTNVDFIVNPE